MASVQTSRSFISRMQACKTINEIAASLNQQHDWIRGQCRSALFAWPSFKPTYNTKQILEPDDNATHISRLAIHPSEENYKHCIKGVLERAEWEVLVEMENTEASLLDDMSKLYPGLSDDMDEPTLRTKMALIRHMQHTFCAFYRQLQKKIEMSPMQRKMLEECDDEDSDSDQQMEGDKEPVGLYLEHCIHIAFRKKRVFTAESAELWLRAAQKCVLGMKYSGVVDHLEDIMKDMDKSNKELYAAVEQLKLIQR